LARDRRTVERFTKEPRWRALDGRLGGDLWIDEIFRCSKGIALALER